MYTARKLYRDGDCVGVDGSCKLLLTQVLIHINIIPKRVDEPVDITDGYKFTSVGLTMKKDMEPI